MKHLTILLFLLIFAHLSHGQTYTVQGKIEDKLDHSSFPGATVVLLNLPDSANEYGVTTGLEGDFTLQGVKAGDYLLQINFMGYSTYNKNLNVNGDLKLGTLGLEQSTTTLKEIEIVGETMVGTQKGDTTEFGAQSFKTTRDASAQDLVTKMPGITVVNGEIQAQGEAVQKILVDGKPFFEGDVKTALQNLPSEVIAAIQVYDKKSDKAELTGFDDGEQVKTINIITKPGKKRGQFGKASAGYGTDDHYQAAASVNMFSGDQRITFTGLSNNINMVNYSADANSQGEQRTQNGIIKTNNFGVNYSNEWNKLKLAANYNFSKRDNDGSSTKQRTYILASDSGQVYNERSFDNRINTDHYLHARLDYEIDSNNVIRWRPYAAFRHDENHDSFFGDTDTDNGLLNSTDNESNSKNSDYDFGSNLYYSHKFDKKGRSITLEQTLGYHTNQDDADRVAENIYYNREDSVQLLNQVTDRERNAYDWGAGIMYTEPISESSMLAVEYHLSNKINDSDKRTYDDNNETYVMDTTLSNTFNSGYFTQRGELQYKYQDDKWRVQLGAQYQQADLNNEQEFPKTYKTERTFNSVLPSVRLDYQLAKSKKLELDYFTWTNSPSIGQLQEVIDNSNPLQLSTGNPTLEQAYNHWVRARYKSNTDEGRTLYSSIESSVVSNYITNATTIASEPEYVGNVFLEEGTQLTRPENTESYYSFKLYSHYGTPIEWVKSNLNIRGMVEYSRRPGVINDVINHSNNTHFMADFSLSSNISEKVDFNISTRSDYFIANNSLRPALNNEYMTQYTHVKLNWIFGPSFIYRTDVGHQVNTGLADGFDKSYVIMNMSFGKKILKDDLGELAVNVYDLLDENNNVGRSVTETYIEDRQSTVLNRYFMLSFTYNIRHFSRGASEKDFKM